MVCIQGLILLYMLTVSAMIEDGTPIENLPCIAQTFVRPLHRFPKDFDKAVKEIKQSTIAPVQNERMLLNSLLGQESSHGSNSTH
jgi:DNA polymerase alpha subunit A